MTQQTNGKPLDDWTEPLYEAPVSATVKLNYRGYDTMLTIRGKTGAEVLTKLDTALTWLEDHGAEATRPAPASSNGNGPKVCSIHHVAMKERSKNGDTWHSHKAVDPETGTEFWCRGKEDK